MDPALRSKILHLLDENRILSVATLRPDGWPQATTVGYANEGLRLYFLCGRDSQKAKNLAWDDRVSLTIDHDVRDPLAIRGLSMAGHASPILDSGRVWRIVANLMPKKFPEFDGRVTEAQLADLAAFEVIPKVVSVLDYSLGFGHADLVEVRAEDL